MTNITAFFAGMGWHAHTCSSCNRLFFSKKEEDGVCGWRKCDSYVAVQESTERKTKRFIPLSEVLQRFLVNFYRCELFHEEPVGMQNGFNTDFVSAGVQVFSDAFQGKREYSLRELFLAQPCVRTSTGKNLGASSASFVNLCTESTCITLERHLELVNEWITFLSSVGLHASRLRVVMREKEENWGFGAFTSQQLFFVYMGEELGEASYVKALPNSPTASLSDIGFGLERITWAVNWFRCAYSSLTSNPALKGAPELHDSARTIALLACAGVKIGARNAEGNFRKIVKAAAALGTREDLVAAVMFYLDFWKDFYSTTPDHRDMLAMIGKELDREKITSLRERFHVDVNPEMTLVELADYLMYTRGVRFEEIQCHI